MSTPFVGAVTLTPSEGAAPAVSLREKPSIWFAASTPTAVLSSTQSTNRFAPSAHASGRLVLRLNVPVLVRLFNEGSGTQLPATPLKL